MAHAWALRRLEERYSDRQANQLDLSTRSTLQLLAKDHIATIQSQIAATSKLLTPLLDWPSSPDLPARAKVTTGNWQESVLYTFESVETVQQEVRALLTRSANSAASIDVMADDLRQRLNTLQQDLPTLALRVSSSY
jgi:hypothetical protein